MALAKEELTLEWAKKRMEGFLPEYMGIEITKLCEGAAEGRIAIKPHHVAPNGYLHAATLVALADTVCGYGATASLPKGALGFTTAELKSNHMGTVRKGAIFCRATARHLGGSTQVWDAEVSDEATGKVVMLFRCTQMVLWPKG